MRGSAANTTSHAHIVGSMRWSRRISSCDSRLHARDIKQRAHRRQLQIRHFLSDLEKSLEIRLDSLPEQVSLRLHEQVPASAAALFVRVIAHYGYGYAYRLAHDEFCCGGQ